MAFHFPRLPFVEYAKAAFKHSAGRRFARHRYLLQNKSTRQQILREGLFSVHYYPPLSEQRVQVEGDTLAVSQHRYAIPVVLVPPLGVYGWVFDLMTERSLVRYFLAHGFAVYMIDWGRPGNSENYLSLETYTLNWFPKAIAVIREHSGQAQVSIVGYCMGGLLALIYTAAEGKNQVKNLVTIASPVNMHQMSSAIGKAYQLLSVPAGMLGRLTRLDLNNFDSRLFHVNGKLLSLGFQLTQPTAMLSSYLDLIRNIGNQDYVSRYTTMNEWFTNMPDYPGATMREMIEKFGLANRMNHGYFHIGGQQISFKNIQCALLAIAGDNDAITSIGAASPVMTVVGSLDKSFEVVPGGHAGLFTGTQAVKTTWVIVTDWLKRRSGEALSIGHDLLESSVLKSSIPENSIKESDVQENDG
ncbi:MAG: alpha/beta fold hydrolase [Moraxellaceae bacterium]|nr:MAG: alpha/beta fold hydrolase [Moraxellaceae bacterium]